MFCTAGRSAWRRTCRPAPSGAGRRRRDARRHEEADARIWLPVSAYLVEHPKGLFLVDAGLPRTVSPTGIEDRAAQLRMFGRGWYTLVHSVVQPGQSIGEQLAARGIRPQDLDYVLFSHLDPDHIAGISEVRGAKRLLAPEEEYFWSCRVNLRYTSRRLWMDEPPERFWYRVNHIGPESRSYDLFGDDSVHLVHIAGSHGGHVCSAHPQRRALCAAQCRRCGESPLVGGGHGARHLRKQRARQKSARLDRQHEPRSRVCGVAVQPRSRYRTANDRILESMHSIFLMRIPHRFCGFWG
ncbi:MAG: MBL fold metallo-hydrolase [Oscillospiraceae bacterium]